jgi:hypothetical protein
MAGCSSHEHGTLYAWRRFATPLVHEFPQPTAHTRIFMNFHNDQVEPILAGTSFVQPRLHMPPLARHAGLGWPTKPGIGSTRSGLPTQPALT